MSWRSARTLTTSPCSPRAASAGWGGRLRLVNPGTTSAEVIIEGVDDEGRSPDTAVRLALARRGRAHPHRFSSSNPETQRARAVRSATGPGTGACGWTANQPLEVLILLASPTGYWANLSTSPGPTTGTAPGPDPTPDPEDAEAVFRERISGPVVQAKCVACHVAGGVSGNTRLVFVRASEAGHEARNLRAFENFLTEVDDGASVVLNKIQGVAHGGGVQVAAGTADFAHMERFLRLLGEEVSALTLTPQTLFDTVLMAPWRKTLRRAALGLRRAHPHRAGICRRSRGWLERAAHHDSRPHDRTAVPRVPHSRCQRPVADGSWPIRILRPRLPLSRCLPERGLSPQGG